jgi:DNA-binding response OmpR family regulator
LRVEHEGRALGHPRRKANVAGNRIGVGKPGQAVRAQAPGKGQDRAYDVIVLDRDLPRVHGDAVCTQLAASPANGRILMLTAAGAVEDRVDGLNLGADDYLAKPFDFGELVARVLALGRRAPSSPPVLRRHDLLVDRCRRRVSRSGRLVPLTRKELGVLEVLLVADGAVVSAEQLLEQVWDEFADPFTNAVADAVMRLRRKLGDPPLIETVIGGGYRIP